MLEPVALGQGRTHTPGLSADERGVMMGKKLALLFGDVARAVGFLRSYSREVSLDDILPSLSIKETVSERGGRELAIVFDCNSSYAADVAAHAARTHRGRVFTGTQQHFVPFRDRKSPLGYDVASADTVVNDSVELVLYSDAGADRRRFGRAIRLTDLILGLSPRPLQQQELQNVSLDGVVIRCETGLVSALCRYLWSRQIHATVTTASTLKDAAHFVHGQPRDVALVRCQTLKHHIANLLSSTPGLTLFVPDQPHVLVQWGFRHPIALESCGKAFSEEEIVLFFAPPQKTERLRRSDEEVEIKDLISIEVRGRDGAIDAPATAPHFSINQMNVDMRLVRVTRASAATSAVLIPVERMAWFRKLIYMMPAAVLRAYDVALTKSHIIVVNRRGVHGIPFGEPMTESYPQVFLPVGMQLVPRVEYELLREHLHIVPDQRLYFFPEHDVAFSVETTAFAPLSRAVVAPERAKTAIIEARMQELESPLPAPRIAHLPSRVLSLWRPAGRISDDTLALPAHEADAADDDDALDKDAT